MKNYFVRHCEPRPKARRGNPPDNRWIASSAYRLLAMTWFFVFMCVLSVANPAHAIDAGEQLADPVLEQRAVSLGDALRCMVCQSESINDSPADLARDLRKIVREKLVAGMSDKAVLDYLHDRYGDYVLLKPPVKERTLPLWLGPWVFLGIGLLFTGLYVAKQKRHKD